MSIRWRIITQFKRMESNSIYRKSPNTFYQHFEYEFEFGILILAPFCKLQCLKDNESISYAPKNGLSVNNYNSFIFVCVFFIVIHNTQFVGFLFFFCWVGISVCEECVCLLFISSKLFLLISNGSKMKIHSSLFVFVDWLVGYY